MNTGTRGGRGQAIVALAIVALGFARGGEARASGAQIAFDLPASVECRDVTPPEFAAGDYLKVIEGKVRISARLLDGSEEAIVDFVYLITNGDERMRFQDFLPNTTLESSVADDQIEIKDASETAKAASADVHVVYKLLALGGTLSQSSKNSESSHYRQIASKEVVVSSGTTDREHGVFFRLRPSRNGSLEGVKEFSFLATVPKAWRGDVCTISCRAKVKQDSFWSSTTAVAGAKELEVGLYLAGDVEAASLAEELRKVQADLARLQTAPPAKSSMLDSISGQTVGLFSTKKPDARQKKIEAAADAVSDVRRRLSQLAR